jgi:hypothetical protein
MVFGLPDGFTHGSCHDQRLDGFTGRRHLEKAVIVAIPTRQFDVEIVPIRERADGLRGHDNVFR